MSAESLPETIKTTELPARPAPRPHPYDAPKLISYGSIAEVTRANLATG